jgi:hypothetical protein
MAGAIVNSTNNATAIEVADFFMILALRDA